MTGGDKGMKDKAMAAHLKKIGIFHGRHLTTTNAPCVPNINDVGSAAYRRRMKKEAK